MEEVFWWWKTHRVLHWFCVRTLSCGRVSSGCCRKWRDCLRDVEEKDYDLCISDIRTPMDEWDRTVSAIESECPEAVYKFIFTTGDMLSGNVKTFLEETGRPCLPSPLPWNLRAIVKTVWLRFRCSEPSKDTEMTNHEQRILIVDDEPWSDVFCTWNSQDKGYIVRRLATQLRRWDKMTIYPADLIMLDMKCWESGMELLVDLKVNYLHGSDYGNCSRRSQSCIQCMRLGADDYITSHSFRWGCPERRKNLEKRKLEQQIKEYQEQLQQSRTTDRRIRSFFSVPSRRWFLLWKPRTNTPRGIPAE